MSRLGLATFLHARVGVSAPSTAQVESVRAGHVTPNFGLGPEFSDPCQARGLLAARAIFPWRR
jgi:hypothetical protein